MVVVWSDLAYESLYDIVAYIQGFFGKKVAIETSIRIENFVASIAQNPLIGKRVSKRTEYGEIRCILYKKNQIYYSVNEDRIDIILIWDGRQDPRKLKQLLTKYQRIC